MPVASQPCMLLGTVALPHTADVYRPLLLQRLPALSARDQPCFCGLGVCWTVALS